MPYPHVIRLRAPWELVALSPTDTIARQRVDVPHDWSATFDNAFTGTARYSRTFNRPTGLESHERVWLCIGGATEQAAVFINGASLGAAIGPAGGEFDITPDLRSHNELAIEVSSSKPGGGLTGEVRLEIRLSGAAE